MAAAQPVSCVPVAATDPLYILYTSGTTGKPKGAVRDNGGHAVALAWSMQHVYDTQPGDVYWAASRKAGTSRCPRPSTTRPPWMRSGRSCTAADEGRRWQ